MRLIAQEPRNPPNDVKKYLLLHEREHQVITVRMHPAVLLAPVELALAGLIGAVVLNGSALKQQGGTMAIVWIAWGILALWAPLYALVRWDTRPDGARDWNAAFGLVAREDGRLCGPWHLELDRKDGHGG